MGRVLCIWEFSEDKKYLAQVSGVAKALADRGHEVHCVLKDVAQAESYFIGPSIFCLQAPVWLPTLRKRVPAENVVDLLLYKGYASPETLESLVRSWVTIFDAVRPDCIFFDFSPTAMLASRGIKVPKVVFGQPLTSLAPGISQLDLMGAGGRKVDPTKEHFLVSVVNQICHKYGVPQVNFLSDLFEADKTILLGFDELDYYRIWRRQATYVGALPPPIDIDYAEWRFEYSPAVFACLEFRNSLVDPLLEVLAKLDIRVVCYLAGATEQARKKYSKGNIFVSATPFEVHQVARSVDYIVCHGDAETLFFALQNGCPLVLAPVRLKQVLTCELIENWRLGVVIKKEDPREVIEDKLINVFEDSTLFDNAKSIADRYRGIFSSSRDAALNVIADACDGLVAGSPRENLLND